MPTTYADFVQRVRRHRPSELLPVLATTAISLFDPEAWTADRVRFPWAIAAAAKASIVASNEHRRPGATGRDVLQICALYNALETPLADDPGDSSESVGAFFVRTSYEQFRYQQSHFEEISRFAALFEGIDDFDTEVLDAALIMRLLGCSLGEFIVAGFVIATGAQASNGYFDPEWPALNHGRHAIDPHFSMDIVRHVFRNHFLATFEQICDVAKKAEQPDVRLRHHEFNPLVASPFVTLPTGSHIAPQPHFAFHRLSPSTLYYIAVKDLVRSELDAFTRDIGRVFQDYVGRQLRLICRASVLPEIVYDGGQRTIDWFVIFDDLVALVEVKATPMTQLGRMGASKLKSDVTRSIGEAFQQVARTETLLAGKHPALATIPIDRPRIALVVTLEPYWGANSAFLGGLVSEPVLPTAIASARSLERLVDVLRDAGGPEPLLEIVRDEDRRTWSLEAALPHVELPKNPILAAAWDQLPFPVQGGA